MAGLSDALTKTTTQATALPSWYTAAQQNVVNQAQQAQAPQFAQTVGGQQAMGAFQAGQPYQQAAGTLGAIASGAANPWTVSPTGTVTPNVATPLGGLFQAQTDYLTSMMPDVSAGPTAGAIGRGQFGSSANEAAVARARAQAINQLFQQQQQAGLQSQQTGATAAGALGTLGGTQLQNAINLATAEQAGPFQAAINRANILGKMNQPGQTQTTSEKLGALQQLSAIGGLGTGAYNSLFGGQLVIGPDGKVVMDPATGKPMVTPGVLGQAGQNLLGSFKNIIGGLNFGSGTPVTGTTVTNADGTTTQTYDDGSTQTFDSNGNVIDSTPATDTYGGGFDSSNLTAGDYAY